MRQDLLRAVSEEKDITNAIVLTHNIDFVFIQTVVLSALRKCGHPSLTVFADASCAASSFEHQARLLTGLGVRYRVVPVEMNRGFRFHPKALLLSGPTSAKLYIGSGNLTFGGWRENAEVWVGFDSATDGTAPFAAFLLYLTQVVERIALQECVRGEIEEAYDAKSHLWAVEMAGPAGLVGRIANGPPLLDQMLDHVTVGYEKVTVCAPYFDADAEALSNVTQRSGAASVEVLVQRSRTGLTETAWKRVVGPARLAPITFQHTDDHGKLRDAFLHAKFYAFENAGRVTVFAGSANCSRAALTIPGTSGNAELMAVREMSADEFKRSFMDEFVSLDGSPELAAEVPDFDPERPTTLRILGCSYEDGHLRIAYAPGGWRITRCSADDLPVLYERMADGLIGARIDSAPRRITVEGTDGDTAKQIAHGWVDHEWELRSTARERNMAETIRNRVRTGDWGVGAWSEVLEVFCAHLRYLPSHLAAPKGGTSRSKQDRTAPIEYSAKDVFAPGYGMPLLSSYLVSLQGGAEGRIRSLQQLLLRWFGLPLPEPANDTDEKPPPEPNDGGDDEVDRPENLPTKTEREDIKPGERDLRRVERLVTQMSEAMTSAEFLSERPPALLVGDLKVASALLRVALREGWLDSDRFFEITNGIWVPLFFDASGKGRGWFQERYESASDPDEFALAIRSPELLAALVAWVAGVSHEIRHPSYARFSLAAVLAVARLPWLWDGVDDNLVCRELAALLACTGPSSTRNEQFSYDQVGEVWLGLLQRGHALRRLERAISGLTPAELAPRIQQKSLQKGEILWQGIAGFCVVSEQAERTQGSNVSVLPLRGKREPTRQGLGGRKASNRDARQEKSCKPTHDGQTTIQFKAALTVPLVSLIEPAVVPVTDDFGARPRALLKEFLIELVEGFAAADPMIP